jgi:pyruvate/2-oxoglutarate dehydrogenase complex dihydrolipoamide dehydrogenase (E3) component
MGTGHFVAPKTLEVRLNDSGTRLLTGDRVFLNVGTHATIPDIPGLAAAHPLTHIEALELDRLPEHLIVLGGGYVGLEFAQAYRRFGSRVTMVERGPQLVGREDPDVAGVELGRRGYIKVNDRLETSASGVWAIGECAGSPHFTHVSFDDFRVIRDKLAGGNKTTRDRVIPFCLFIDPPLARIGLNEGEASRRGIEVRVARLPMSAVLRTRTISETRGVMKALVDAQSDRIVGFTMLGLEAGEVMAIVQTAVLAGMPYPGLRDAILTHPTMAEGLVFLFSNVPPPARGGEVR